MSARFFIDPANWNPSAPELPADEAHHAADVLRLREGDAVTLFNGRGDEQSARILAIARRRVDLVPGPVSRSRPLPCRIHLAQAIPKGKNMDLIVQKATELGAASILPVVSERVIVRLDPEEVSSKQFKWQRIAIEACKQSGQNFLPAVAAPAPMAEVVASAPRSAGSLMIIASLLSGARHLKEILAEAAEMNGSQASEVTLFIGPEGDFTPAEVNLALAAGAQPMSLGPIVLRTETAALYGLSVLAHELQSVPD